MAVEHQDLAWYRHINVAELKRLMGPTPSFLIIGFPTAILIYD
jgi:hypothetical protein